MKLYAKTSPLSLREKYRFFNEEGKNVYVVSGKPWSFVYDLTMTDPEGSEVASIREKFFTLRPTFTISEQGKTALILRKTSSFRSQRFQFENKGWDIKGDLWNREYTIIDGENIIASISRKKSAFNGTYEMEIYDPKDAVLGAAITLWADCIGRRQSAVTAGAVT